VAVDAAGNDDDGSVFVLSRSELRHPKAAVASTLANNTERVIDMVILLAGSRRNIRARSLQRSWRQTRSSRLQIVHTALARANQNSVTVARVMSECSNCVFEVMNESRSSRKV